MITQVEKKYRVDSFTPILNAVQSLGATPTYEVTSQHYYAPLDSDDTIKMIDYGNKIEIHSLRTTNGLHSLDEVVQVKSIQEGLSWFAERGYDSLEVLDMNDKEYSYKNGGFALYTINNDVYSVILGYAEDQLAAIEAELGLQNARPIAVPYNKYMRTVGQVKTIVTH